MSAGKEYISHLPLIHGQDVVRDEIRLPLSNSGRDTVIHTPPGKRVSFASPMQGNLEQPANDIVLETTKPLRSDTILPDVQADSP